MTDDTRGSDHAPKVLIVTATDRRRGAEVFTERLVGGLAARGWVAGAVSLTASGADRTVDVEPLTDVSSARPGRYNLEIRRELAKRIRAVDPDVVIANGGSTLRYCATVRLPKKAKLVYIAIGEPRYWIRSGVSRLVNRRLLRRSALVLSVCSETRRQLLELEPSLAGRIEVTYTGVPDEMFTVRHESSGPLRVAMIGSLSDEKDPALALRTVAATPGVALRMVGDGPLAGELRRQVAALSIEDRVELIGAVDDVAAHLQWADLLILTSRTEGLPGAVLEAGAAGVPSLAVDVGGVSEAVRDGLTGVIADRDDEQGLVRALTRLSVEPETVRRMGVAARLHVKEHFAMGLILAGYESRLVRLIS
jgi:glycosyltransferase involved in cell wall biosynthesis